MKRPARRGDRIEIRIDRDLLQRAKATARDLGYPLAAIIRASLREVLEHGDPRGIIDECRREAALERAEREQVERERAPVGAIPSWVMFRRWSVRARTLARHYQQLVEMTHEEWLETCEFFGWRCAYCLCDLTLNEGYDWATMDHLIPGHAGGRFVFGNILPTCKPCNVRKARASLTEHFERQSRGGSAEAVARVAEFVALAERRR